MSAEAIPLSALGRGIAAGAVGTAAMTAAQTVYYKITGSEASTTPAEVAKRIIRGVLHRDVPDDHDVALTNAMHWSYGTGWGALFGLTAAGRTPGRGLLFGTAVWAASLVELPAMKLAPPPWQYDLKSIAPDLGFHLVYGVATATAYRALG